MLAFESEPFELPHLPRERSLEKLILDVQAEPFARGHQVARIRGQLCIRVSTKHQKRLQLPGRHVGHEQQLA